MKTSVKALIAGTVTAVAATFSTGASAQSLGELHEQHKAQLLNLLSNITASIHIGPAAPVYAAPAPVYAPAPAYVPPPAYVDPHGGRHGWNGPRGYERRGYEHSGYAQGGYAQGGYAHNNPNQPLAQYENGRFIGYTTEAQYARPNGR